MQGTPAKILILVGIIVLGGTAALIFNGYMGAFNRTELPPIYQMPEAPEPIETTLFFAGDIMLSRNVGTKIVQANDPTLPFQKISEVTKAADISFANLESPFNNKEPRITQILTFKAEPNTVEGLVHAGLDIFSTANNHSFDQDKEGINYTLDWLKQSGIKTVGTGIGCHDGVIIEAGGSKFGYLAYSYAAHNDGGKTPDPLVCDWNDQKQVAQDIKILKPQVDFLIISSHMGEEYKREPEPANAQAARAAIDAGADLFIGHHPHWIQTIEEYKGKYIFYSLGNFVFDQMWSQDTREGLAVKVLFKDKNLDRIELLPVVIDDYCCPRWANQEETKSILSKINSNYSSPVMAENGRTTVGWIAAIQNPESENSSAPLPSDLTNNRTLNKND